MDVVLELTGMGDISDTAVAADKQAGVAFHAEAGLAGNDPEWDSSAQSEPEFEFDQRMVTSDFYLVLGALVRVVQSAVSFRR